MYKFIKPDNESIKASDVIVDADFNKISSESLFPDSSVRDLDSVIDDFNSRVTAVLDAFEENFLVRPDLAHIEVYSVGDDNINVNMSSTLLVKSIGYLIAEYFNSELSSWMRYTKSEIDTSKYYVDSKLDRTGTVDGKAGCTISIEEN